MVVVSGRPARECLKGAHFGTAQPSRQWQPATASEVRDFTFPHSAGQAPDKLDCHVLGGGQCPGKPTFDRVLYSASLLLVFRERPGCVPKTNPRGIAGRSHPPCLLRLHVRRRLNSVKGAVLQTLPLAGG